MGIYLGNNQVKPSGIKNAYLGNTKIYESVVNIKVYISNSINSSRIGNTWWANGYVKINNTNIYAASTFNLTSNDEIKIYGQTGYDSDDYNMLTVKTKLNGVPVGLETDRFDYVQKHIYTHKSKKDLYIEMYQQISTSVSSDATGYVNIYEIPSERYPVGGRIFYDNGSNSAKYFFFDSNNNLITDHSISGLANAVTYCYVGTPTSDRWYVANLNLQSGLYWGGVFTSFPTDSSNIGYGKIYTQNVFNSGIPTDYTPNIWGYCKQCRDNLIGNCNDWYILNMGEQNALKNSNIVTWFTNNSIWCSQQYNSEKAIYWKHSTSAWTNTAKNTQFNGFVGRSF